MLTDLRGLGLGQIVVMAGMIENADHRGKGWVIAGQEVYWSLSLVRRYWMY